MTDGTMNTIVSRVEDLLDVDAVNDLIDGIRSLYGIDDKYEGVYINVLPKSERPESVQTSNAKGREFWVFEIWVDVGIYLHKEHVDMSPVGQASDIISGAGAVWDAIQGDFLLDGATPFLDVPMRSISVEYDKGYRRDEKGGEKWEVTSIYQCKKYINNPT